MDGDFGRKIVVFRTFALWRFVGFTTKDPGALSLWQMQQATHLCLINPASKSAGLLCGGDVIELRILSCFPGLCFTLTPNPLPEGEGLRLI